MLEEGDKARFIGIGDDTEYVNGETERKDMPKEYLRLVREVALKEKKQKVARAVDIILRVYYNEEEGEQGKSSESL